MFKKIAIQEEKIEGIIQRCGFVPVSEFSQYFIFTIKGFSQFFILSVSRTNSIIRECALTKEGDFVSFSFNKDFSNHKTIEIKNFLNITFTDIFNDNSTKNNFDKIINITN